MWRVWVPATLANLGSGFDALGVALALDLAIEAELAQRDEFIYQGQGEVPEGTNNLIHQGYRAYFADLGISPPPVAIKADNPIPMARGMGSSSAALVAGIALADLVSGRRAGPDQIFKLAARLEGHPDNVAPAVYGGFVLALANPPIAVPLPSPPDLVFVLGVPSYGVLTQKAREVLPKQVPLADACFNLARAALWPAALCSGRLELLREASHDSLHQSYRASLYPGAQEAIRALEKHGALAAFVGGAGPTLAGLALEAKADSLALILSEYSGPGGNTMKLAVGGGYRWKEV